MRSNSKGIGNSDCCCAGCYSPPYDGRAASSADIILSQSLCCRCLPKYLCVRLTAIGDYDTSYVLLNRYCGSIIPGQGGEYSGGPIQFMGNIFWDNDSVLIIIRLDPRYDGCYLLWEIPEKDLSGDVLINQSEKVSDYQCGHGQKIDKCVNFGGEWDLGDRTLTLSPAETIDIKSNINCAGCSCMCKCICLSIASRTTGEGFTITGSNEVVCATINHDYFTDCSGEDVELIKSINWNYEGWNLTIYNNDDAPINSGIVVSGTEVPYYCDLHNLLRVSDSQEHIIISHSGISEVDYYSFGEIEEKPLYLKWIGRSVDEDSETEFYLYNWTESDWDYITRVDGRDDLYAYNKYKKILISDQYLNSENDFKLKVKAINSSGLYTDLLRVHTTSCCRIKLNPPVEIIPETILSPIDLSVDGNCPSPFKFWNFFDQNDTEWFVSFSCSWCGGRCGGGTAVDCCPNPVSNTLFAEVYIDCPSCTNPFIVMLINTLANIWTGEGFHCSQPFSVVLSCAYPNWKIVVEGAGGCNFSGFATSSDCNPFNLEFNGNFQGGIGCCGVGSMTTSTSISITVFE